MTATFVIDEDSVVGGAFVEPDFTIRQEPSDILATVRQLAGSQAEDASASDATSGQGVVGGDALPAPVTKLIIVGIAARALRPVRVHVGGPGVDDGEVAEDADHDIMLVNVLDGGTTANLGKEGLAIDQ
jgi:hypothetical protein